MSEAKSVNGFDVYRMYVALKNHFNKSDYDYFKYQGKVNVKKETFQTRKDRWHFERIAKKYREDSFNFLLSNLMEDPNFWVGRAFDKKCEKRHLEWLRFMESDGYCFHTDISTLKEYCDEYGECFNDMFEVIDNKHPRLYLLYKKDIIHFCTLCYLASISGFHNNVLEEMPFDPIWKNVHKKIEKVYPFMQHKTKGFEKIVVDIFEV